MTTFLFWNVNKNPLQKIIANLALRYSIDVLILVESLIQPIELLRLLNSSDVPRYNYAPGECKKVQIFVNFSKDFIRPIQEENRLTMRHLKLPGFTDIILAVTHFPSKYNWSPDSQAQECGNLIDNIKLKEKELGHCRTVLIGDLNMNPFESGVISAKGLHAIMSKQIVEKGSRVVQNRIYPFFYNPMWSLFGDANRGPPGTYYYTRSEHVVFYWNMFDQVLIRPELLDRFKNEDLEILDTDGNTAFLSKDGIPNKHISDHLPILFRLGL
jgi:hypothetical protein